MLKLRMVKKRGKRKVKRGEEKVREGKNWVMRFFIARLNSV